MYSDKLFQVFVLPKGSIWDEDFNVFNEANDKKAAKLAQFVQLLKPYSHDKGAWFELRSSTGTLCKAEMPPLGSGTTLVVRRINADSQTNDKLKGQEYSSANGLRGEEGSRLPEHYVWRLTTEIDFFSPWRLRTWREQIGRMNVELDGSTERKFRLVETTDEDGRAQKEWRTVDIHQVERWRAALRPMQSATAENAAAECAQEGTSVDISMSKKRELLREETEWRSEAFSAQVHHDYKMREWSTLTVPPGQHIPLGLLAGQLCSRVLAPRNIGQALKLSQDAPLVSRREWDEGWSRLGQEWASKIRCEPVSTAALAEAFRPVQPKAGVSDLKRYPDYHGKLSDYVTDPVLKERAVNGGIVGLGALLASLVVAPLLL